MANIDQILGSGQTSKWTREEFQAMDRKDLRFFAVWNGDASKKWPKHYDAIVKEKGGFDEVDAALAFEVYSSSTAKKFNEFKARCLFGNARRLFCLYSDEGAVLQAEWRKGGEIECTYPSKVWGWGQVFQSGSSECFLCSISRGLLSRMEDSIECGSVREGL